MAKVSNNQQSSLFGEQEIQTKVVQNKVPQRKRGVTLTENYRNIETRGLNALWKEFGEFIENERNNKTL